MNELEFVERLALGLACGVAIGLERQWRQRMAGLRTTALVATGACLFVILSVILGATSTPDRIAAQVVSGIGFLGAGVITFAGGRRIVRVCNLRLDCRRAGEPGAASPRSQSRSADRNRLYVPELKASPAFARHVTLNFERQAGIKAVRLNTACATLVVTFEPARTSVAEIASGGAPDEERARMRGLMQWLNGSEPWGGYPATLALATSVSPRRTIAGLRK